MWAEINAVKSKTFEDLLVCQKGMADSQFISVID